MNMNPPPTTASEPVATFPLFLDTCRLCGAEQHDFITRGGVLALEETTCRCSILWLLNPDHPEAEQKEKEIRAERRRRGLCAYCSDPVVGVKNKAQYCESCRKFSRLEMQRRSMAKPKVRQRYNRWQKKRRQQRLATDPEYRESYQTRYKRSLPAEGTPEYEELRAKQQARRNRYAPRKKQLRKKENRFQDGEKPTCAHCGDPVEWGGVGKPKMYCAEHEPTLLRCEGCGRNIRWVPEPGPRPRFHDESCAQLARNAQETTSCTTCGEPFTYDAQQSKGKAPKYCQRTQCKPVQKKCECGCGAFFSFIAPARGRKPKYHPLCLATTILGRTDGSELPPHQAVRRLCECGCGQSFAYPRGARGRPPVYHPLCATPQLRDEAYNISIQRLKRRNARDEILRALYAEQRGPGHMADVTGQQIGRVLDDLKRIGLVTCDEDHVYARREWWEQRLLTWEWPAWQAIQEAGLRSHAARVDQILDRFGLTEIARPTRGKARSLPQLRDRHFLETLLERNAGSYAAAAREVGCMADYLAKQVHMVLGIPKQNLGPAPKPRPLSRTAAVDWKTHIHSGATLEQLTDVSGLDADEIIAETTRLGLDGQLWRNVARYERSQRNGQAA